MVTLQTLPVMTTKRAHRAHLPVEIRTPRADEDMQAKADPFTQTERPVKLLRHQTGRILATQHDSPS
jgi:hypothetical protein